MLLKKEADLAGVVADQDSSANFEKKKQAVEILSLVINHPTTWRVFKDKAALLLAELEAELPPEVVATAWAQGQAQDVLMMGRRIAGRSREAAVMRDK